MTVELKDGKIVLTPDIMRVLKEVNYEINNHVGFKRDMLQYDRDDYWDIALDSQRGDCEDYALTKRYVLKDRGFPMSAMKIALCWVEGSDGDPGEGEYHAVLIIETDKGAFVLDNRYWDIKNYLDFPYKWDRIENPSNRRWLKIRT